MAKVIAVKTIESTGETINITKVHKNAGTHEGEACDLYQYLKNGVKYLVEAPLIAK